MRGITYVLVEDAAQIGDVLCAKQDGQEQVSAARLLPVTEFLHETDAVADGNQDYFHAGISGDRVVEGADRGDVIVVREIAGDMTALERVSRSIRPPGRRRVSTSS
jgi:hypothetical protein